MNILNFLCAKNHSADEECDSRIETEFRLCCSGVLYPKGFMGDWRKSDGARLFLVEPFQLIVASRQYDTFPQEFALRFQLNEIVDTKDNFTISSFPTAEIAEDIASLLTLFCRRLFTVGGEVRQRHHALGVPESLKDFPFPVIGLENPSHWSRRPVHVVTSLEKQEVIDYQPPPHGIDRAAIRDKLMHLPHLSSAEAIVRAARRYAIAMELIESRPEIAYQMLISAIETIAGAVLSSWTPDEDQQLETRGKLFKEIKNAGVNEVDARRIVLQDCKSNPWSRRKFVEFLIRFVDEEMIESEDDLFVVLEEFHPKKTDFKKAVGDIYSMRSGASHSGHAFPMSASMGISPLIPVEVTRQLVLGNSIFPPISWFERIVNSAICNCVGQLIDKQKDELSNE